MFSPCIGATDATLMSHVIKNSFADIIIRTELKMCSKRFPLGNSSISPSFILIQHRIQKKQEKNVLSNIQWSPSWHHKFRYLLIPETQKIVNKCLENQAQAFLQIQNFIICILRVCIMTKNIFLIKITFKCLQFPIKIP